MNSVQQLPVQLRNVTNSKKVITEKRRSVTIPSNGNNPESRPTIHDHDVDKCAEAFIQNFRRQLLLQGDD
ncbi:unnamed protein product [Brassica rapa]|uniref:Uncharacterized protein n=2 Tax=Brassica TaxID=3705 RepID=A0A3P6APH0_BRACM|nr:unnamed protein product [Brassica napus]CAG7893998.1 unnamed protein product [Brassica rapa]CDY37574.1 BnaA02g19960D [Brassica napus]VDC89533.1 unnamed protein product [Brassica rapa]